ncbi:hypothetical protein HDV57DRAFT_86957 [Trichoderma longibrachiatum]
MPELTPVNFNLRSEYQGASLHSLTLFPARPLQSSLRLPRAEGIFHAQWMWASKWSLSRFEEMDIQPDSVPQRTRHLHKYRPLMMSNGCLEQFYMHPTLIHTLYDIESVTVLHYAINESKGRGIAIRGRLQRMMGPCLKDQPIARLHGSVPGDETRLQTTFSSYVLAIAARYGHGSNRCTMANACGQRLQSESEPSPSANR